MLGSGIKDEIIHYIIISLETHTNYSEVLGIEATLTVLIEPYSVVAVLLLIRAPHVLLAGFSLSNRRTYISFVSHFYASLVLFSRIASMYLSCNKFKSYNNFSRINNLCSFSTWRSYCNDGSFIKNGSFSNLRSFSNCNNFSICSI